MRSAHSTSKEQLHTNWFGARDAAQVPMRAQTSADVAGAPTAGERDVAGTSSWSRRLLRVARDIAIGLALITAVPVISVARSGRSPVSYDTESMNSRLASGERWRSLMTPRDAGITPLQAGSALRALMSGPIDEKAPMRGKSLKAERVWQSRKPGVDMFARQRGQNTSRPATTGIIELVPEGFTAQELAYLRDVANSPLWVDFDKVARAQRIDMVGGQYDLPFQSDATIFTLPLLNYADTKALAQAGVSRAAYYLVTGEPARAEAALRSIVSFGFALIDNGVSSIDALIGRVIVDIGRDGLRQFYTVTHHGEMLPSAEVSRDEVSVNVTASRRVANYADYQSLLLNDVRDEQLPRAMRFKSLLALSFTTCSNVGGMLRGPSADVTAAFDYAKKSLARYPSELAFIDLLYDTPNRIPADVFGGQRSVSDAFVSGAATVAATILRNPRIESCTRVKRMFD